MLEIFHIDSKFLTNTVKEYKMCLKGVPEVLETYFYRLIAFPFVKIAQWLHLTPNLCSMFSICFALLGAWQFLTLNYTWAAIFLFFKQVFDVVDGSLARLTNQTSKTGEFIEFYGDSLGGFIILTSLGIGLYQEQQNWWVFVWIYAIGIGSAVQVYIFHYIKDQYLLSYSGVNKDLAILSPSSHKRPVMLRFLINHGLRINRTFVGFPDILRPIIINQQELTFSEKQQLFRKYFFWLTQAWSLIAGAMYCTWEIIWALLRYPFGLFITVLVFNPLLVIGLFVLHRRLVLQFNKRFFSH